MLTFAWSFTAFDCYPKQGDQTDVVFTVHWTRTATDEAGHVGTLYGAIGVNYTAGDPFVPFADLTPNVVTAWVEDALGADTLAAQERALADQIEQQVNPPKVTLPAPWASANAPAV